MDALRLRAPHAQENIDVVIGLTGPPGGTAILDHRVVSYVVSHHQKSSILSSGGEHWAYVGGIDIALDRWDTIHHDFPHPSDRPKENFAAWHDVHSAIRGPAVAQVWENFKQRWDDTRPPHEVAGIPGGAVPAPVTATMPAPPPTTSNHNVQLLRTLACRGTYSFGLDGEQTVRMAYERAIDKAEHYIYVEDQFLWPSSLDKKLNAAAKRGVKIIFVTAHEYEAKSLVMVHNDMQHDVFLDAVREGAPGNVFVFHLRRLPTDSGVGDDIYVHSKVMIIDDCYAAIGSANIGFRSHTSDSELHIAVVDGETVAGHMNGIAVTVCRFARDLRIALWSEHLGSSLAVFEDPIASLPSWPTGSTQVHHAVVHSTPPWYLRSPCLVGGIIGGAVGGVVVGAPHGALFGCALTQVVAAVMNIHTTCND